MGGVEAGEGALQHSSGWGLVARKTKPQKEAWNFQPRPPFFREGGRLERELIIDQEEASIKPQ